MTQVPAEGLISHSLAPDRRLLGRRGWNLARDTGAAGLEFPPHLIGEQHHTVIDLGSVKRLVMIETRSGRFPDARRLP